MFVWWLGLSVQAHVPTFDDAQCVTFKKSHQISQVSYQITPSGSQGGAEIHCSLNDCPFDYANGEMLDVGIVFKKKYPLEKMQARIGCLGCAPEDSHAQQPPLTLEYGHYELEPFTGTRLVGALREADKRYNTSLLDPAGACTSQHFGIVLVVNASMGEDVYWAPVLGLAEEFTGEELILFTSFILALHGDAWSNLGWTVYVVAAVVVLLDLVRGAATLIRGREPFLPTVVNHFTDLRSILLQIAAWSFAVAATEIGLHLLIAQIGAEFTYAFWLGLILMLLIGQLGPYALTIAIWRAHLDRKPNCSASPWWVPLQMASAVSFYFLFGSGVRRRRPSPTRPSRAPHPRPNPCAPATVLRRPELPGGGRRHPGRRGDRAAGGWPAARERAGHGRPTARLLEGLKTHDGRDPREHAGLRGDGEEAHRRGEVCLHGQKSHRVDPSEAEEGEADPYGDAVAHRPVLAKVDGDAERGEDVDHRQHLVTHQEVVAETGQHE